MIRLERTRTQAAISAAFRGEKRILKALSLLVEAGAERKFDSGYWKGAKKQLKKESFGKCAYCEAPTDAVAHGDVEHFRPKSVYWWLAYCYDNYLFSCQICNQTFKSDHFPLREGGAAMPEPGLPLGADDAGKREFVRRFAPDPLDEAEGQPWVEFATRCSDEGCLLLNPYTDDPESHFAWEADEVLREVALRPARSEADPFFQAAVQFYGLNRPELLAERWKTYRMLSTLRKTFAAEELNAELRTAISAEIRQMMAAEERFAGMCRYFVRQVWALPLE